MRQRRQALRRSSLIAAEIGCCPRVWGGSPAIGDTKRRLFCVTDPPETTKALNDLGVARLMRVSCSIDTIDILRVQGAALHEAVRHQMKLSPQTRLGGREHDGWAAKER